jgi:hypothetical protein
MADPLTPNWQPIGFLPRRAEIVDGMRDSAEAVSSSLHQAQQRPYVMDDDTHRCVRDVSTPQRHDRWMDEELRSRWQSAEPTPAQETKIERL